MNAAKLCVWYTLEDDGGGKSRVDMEDRELCMSIDVKKAIKKDVEPALNNVPITKISLVVEGKDGKVHIDDAALMQNVVRDHGINAANPVIVSWQKLTGVHYKRSAKDMDIEGERDSKMFRGNSALTTPEKFNSLLLGIGRGIPDHGVLDLHVARPALVKEIIEAVDKSDQKNFFVQGAAGTGKTILLRDIAQSLMSRGKTVLIAQTPQELEAWFEENEHQLHAVEPDYLLVDEVQQDFECTAVSYFAAKLVVPCLLKARTIFAGNPGDGMQSGMLLRRLDVTALLLSEEDILQQGVVDYFQRLIKQGSTEMKGGEDKQAAMRALRFARQYSAGQMYPCLRLAEFFVKKFTVSELTEENMVKSMVSALEFLAPGGPHRDITKRCFFKLDYKSAALLETCMQGEHSEALPALGLWVGGWLLSPLVHMALLKLVPPPQPRRPVIRSAGDLAKVLSYCCARLRYSDYFERDYAKQAPEGRARCEEGVSFSLGRHLVQLCGAVAFQLSVLPTGVKRARRPPTVDFYLNSALDLYLKVVKNDSDLQEHFERFAVGDQHAAGNKAIVVLSFNFLSPTPEPLPPALKKYQDQFYTFCVKSDTLYTGAGNSVEGWS